MAQPDYDYKSLDDVAEKISENASKICKLKEDKEVNSNFIALWTSVEKKAKAKIQKFEILQRELDLEIWSLTAEIEEINNAIEDQDVIKILEQMLSARKGSKDYEEAKKRFNSSLKTNINVNC